MADDLPPDWAITEMAKRSRTGYPAACHKAALGTWGDLAVIEGARLIAKYEKPPADPLLIEARKFMGNYRGPPLDMEKASADYAAGVHDESNEMRFLRAALRRGIQLASDATASVQSPGCVDAAPGRKG